MERTPTLQAESCSSQEEWNELKAEEIYRENENRYNPQRYAYIPHEDLVSNPF